MTVRVHRAVAQLADAGPVLEAINGALEEIGAAPYADPANVGGLGRAGRSSHTLDVLEQLADDAGREIGSHFLHIAQLVDVTDIPIVYVPRDFERAASGEAGGVEVAVGSCAHLLAELQRLAPTLGIPLDDGRLADEVAGAIVARASLGDAGDEKDDDDDDELRDQREGWLLLFEAAGASLADGGVVALTTRSLIHDPT